MTLSEYQDYIDLSVPARPQPYSTQAEKEEACDALLKFLLRERGMIAAFSAGFEKKCLLLRGYMNERRAMPIPQEILNVQDRLLYTLTLERGVVDISAAEDIKYGISLYEGDLTRLNADGIVNAANSALLGCFFPGHNCIDNTIHSRAGMQVRLDCANIMAVQGTEEETGEAKITRAYNLPSKYILHTVGPRVGRTVSDEERLALKSCYTACLNLAEEMGLKSLAFCSISTGVFNFPRAEAAEIAAGAVVGWKINHPESPLKVIFDTFLPEDTEIYRNILKFI